MTQLTIRDVDPMLHGELKREAARQGTSLNRVVLSLLREAVGLTQDRQPRTYDDLDHLIGIWTDEEAAEFEEAIAPLRAIDPEMWQ
ncbi:MAG: FitA-like ribbon-helix-helix domain-containing protein [Gammaproteobacteria bacterium]